MHASLELFEDSAYHKEWGNGFAHPASIGDRSGLLAWLNNALKDLLTGSDCCRLEDSNLIFSDDAVHTEFLDFLAELDAAPRGFVVRNEKQQSQLILRCELLRPADRQEAVALMFFDTRRKPPYVWCDIGAVFGLTAREAVIAQRLIDGSELSALACELGITDETIKTHLRRIYAKIGASSREQFYVRLLPFRIV